MLLNRKNASQWKECFSIERMLLIELMFRITSPTNVNRICINTKSAITTYNIKIIDLTENGLLSKCVQLLMNVVAMGHTIIKKDYVMIKLKVRVDD